MTQDLFTIKPMNQWIEEAASRPDPRSLFGDFWLEGELAVLFSDAGRGKSILGVQIADSIARGKPIDPVPMTAKPRKVLYFDFEYSAKQFEIRYSTDTGSPKEPYRFPKNFHRAEPAESSPPYEGGVRLQPGGGSLIERKARKLQSVGLAALEAVIRASRARVIVIDSIAWLQGPNITARHTVPLMRELKRLQSTLGLSILILAHNPRRDNSRPLSISGLHGAGVICSFADSVFAIGQSRIDSSFRYLKHIKSRSAELTCDESNVLVGEVRKWEKNFLSFRFHRYSPESDHLVRELNPMIEERALMIKEMSEGDGEREGMTQREIAARLGLSLGSVNRYLQMTREHDDYYDLDDGFDLDDEQDNSKKEAGTGGSPRVSKGAELNKLNELNELNELDGEDPMKRYGLAGIDNELKLTGSAPGSAGGPPALNAQRSDLQPAELSEGSPPYEGGERLQPGGGSLIEREARKLQSAILNPKSEIGAAASTDARVAGVSDELAEPAELDELAEPAELPYKTLDDKIEVGDIVQDRDGRLARKTHWGWDRCADSLKVAPPQPGASPGARAARPH